MKLLKQSSRFYYCWRNSQKINARLLCCFSNLTKKSQFFVQNVNSKPISNLPQAEFDTNHFLKYLLDAHDRGKKTDFDEIFEQFRIKTLLDERRQILENMKNLDKLVEEDKEMQKLAEEEKQSNEDRLKEIDNKLLSSVLENLDAGNFDDVILEITAGVGGQESMLFLKDMVDMYTKHFTYLGYNFELIEFDESAQGGIRHASIMISGEGSFEKLRHEAGVHRVQRIPVTEKSGRIHTSVVSVAILPQPNEIEVVINPKDLKIDTMRASGAGGQHVNTTNSAVRVTHLPTGMVAECQTNRSQLRNRELAIAKLRANIYQEKLTRQLRNASDMRKQQMGMGERHEKIRTYNFNQDRVTDHRISDGTMHNLKGFLNGGEALNSLHEKLSRDMQHKIFLDIVKKLR